MITVFTPTYNRADRIYRVWDSLSSQSYKDFEWVIVDDGSSDNIEEIVKEYKTKANFPITFYKFDVNRGKHNATNKALELAKGTFFMVADSDDGFTSDAIEFFVGGWESIPEDERHLYCGIRACCNDQNGQRVSDTLPYEPLDASMQEVFYKHNFRQESWTMVLTDWHRKFLFNPDHKGYYPEGIIWKAMSMEKKLRFFNKATRIYYIDDDPNSIMSIKKHPKDKIQRNLISGSDILNNDMDYLFYDVKLFLKTSVLYGTYAFFDGSLFAASKKLTNFRAKMLYWMMMPISALAFVYKSIRP